MLILNSGGTLNKRYNALNGELMVPFDNNAVKTILESTGNIYDIAGIVYKDSLDMTLDDRKIIAKVIMESKDDKFIIIHGTDTMHTTAEFLSTIFDDRKILLVGAMKPFEIDNIEAALNIGMAIGFANGTADSGVYICMSGFVEPWNRLVKNTKFGKFEVVQ